MALVTINTGPQKEAQSEIINLILNGIWFCLHQQNWAGNSKAKYTPFE